MPRHLGLPIPRSRGPPLPAPRHRGLPAPCPVGPPLPAPHQPSCPYALPPRPPRAPPPRPPRPAPQRPSSPRARPPWPPQPRAPPALLSPCPAIAGPPLHAPRLLCAVAAGDASSSAPAPRRLVLYTKPGCCLCEGLKEKLHAAVLLAGTPYSLASLELQERDITTNSEWERLYQYEIPVLAKVLPDGTEHKWYSSRWRFCSCSSRSSALGPTRSDTPLCQSSQCGSF
ncbi:vegetative cell wall protein gp1-like [Hordeum vulgare subsp. vulgare]|uniref:vegetative cell wall protein gp1-like n=1 Tax=Hordeum vulgare subsp. vulgare TaxID=112509 RepID=UPI001D1A4A8C|nr:vegetative cell wall protein gp1-like [Hordeum vulgare subsp. vulgare]